MATSQPAPVPSVIYGMPHGQTQPCQQPKYLASIKRTAIMQIIGGSLLICFGIVAIILWAFWSYYVTAIWSGIVIFILSGVLGVLAGNTGNRCLLGGYLGMSVTGSCMGLALFMMHIFAAIYEGDNPYGLDDFYFYGSVCQPGGYYSSILDCHKSAAARQTFDALICITGFFLFILCIVSSSYGCGSMCSEGCCKRCCSGGGCSACCNPTPPPVTAVFTGQGTQVSTGMQQGQPQAGIFIVQQGQPPNMQYPQVAMPPPGSTNQGTASYVIVPAANQVQPIPQSNPSNQTAPPSYYVAGQDHAQYPGSEQAPIDHK